MGILLWDALLWDTLLWENLLWENQLWDNLPVRQSSTVYPPRVTSSRMSPIGKVFSVRSPMGRQSSCRIVSCRTTFYTLHYKFSWAIFFITVGLCKIIA